MPAFRCQLKLKENLISQFISPLNNVFFLSLSLFLYNFKFKFSFFATYLKHINMLYYYYYY